MARYKDFNEVRIYGCVTHGPNDMTYNDNEIKQLVGKNAGAYGRHWVYGERNGRRSLEMKDCDILVVYGKTERDHITFVGRSGLAECIKFLAKLKQPDEREQHGH